MADDVIPTTTVIPCPKCAVPARLADGQEAVRCEACNTMVHRRSVTVGATAGRGDSDGSWERTVMLLGLAILAAGVGVWAFGRHRPATAPIDTRGAPPALGATPPLEAPPSEPVLELAWVAEAKGPVLAQLDGDGAEDVFGFFRVWDGRSAWTMHAGAFRGASLAPLWRTEPLDPWLVRKTNALPLASIVGKHVVVADGTETLRIYALSGQKEATYHLGQSPHDLCALPDGARVWIDAEVPALLDLASGKVTPAGAPASCKGSARGPRATTDGKEAAQDAQAAWAHACRAQFGNRFAHAACLAPDQVGPLRRSNLAYALVDGDARVAFAHGPDATGREVTTTLGWSASGKVLWERPLADAAITLAQDSPPAVAEVSNKTLYVVYGRQLFDGRVEAIDVASGRTAWDVPLVGSYPRTDPVGARGNAVSLVASDTRVYVTRAGGGLDVFDAKTGAPIGTIGNGKP